jgi:hypothetical protein
MDRRVVEDLVFTARHDTAVLAPMYLDDRMPEDRMPEGRMPEGRMPEGRMPEGRMPEGESGAAHPRMAHHEHAGTVPSACFLRELAS